MSSNQMNPEQFYRTEAMAGPYLPTHVEGLDTLLRGGLLLPPNPNTAQEEGFVILIKGHPGTGKTTLAFQIACGATRWKGYKDVVFKCSSVKKNSKTNGCTKLENYEKQIDDIQRQLNTAFPDESNDSEKGIPLRVPLIFSWEQDTNDILATFRRFETDLDECDCDDSPWTIIYKQRENSVEKTHLVGIYNPTSQKNDEAHIPANTSAANWAVEIGNELERIPEKHKAPLIIIDGLNLLSTDERHTFDMERLVKKLRRSAIASILVYEDETGHHECIDYLVDMIIQLEGEECLIPIPHYRNRLCITKSRFQQSVLGWHHYKIRDKNGFLVFPSLHYQTHRFGKIQQQFENSGISINEIGGNENNGEKCPCENKPCFSLYPCQSEDCTSSTCEGFRFPLLQCDGCNANPRNNCIAELLKSTHKQKWEQANRDSRKNYRFSAIEYLLAPREAQASIATTPNKKQEKDTAKKNNDFDTILKRGSCNVVLGGRRTCKTLLTLDFLRAGSANDEGGMLVSLMDNEATIINQRNRLCQWFPYQTESCEDNWTCYKNISLFHMHLGRISPGEFFHWLDKRIRAGIQTEKGPIPIKRLVFWDLTQLEYRFPFLAKEELFVPALVDYLKHKWAITSIFMSASNTEMAQSISAIADNVIFAWRDTKKADKQEKKADGFFFFVDRKEGVPEEQGAYFLPETALEKGTINPEDNKDRHYAGIAPAYAEKFVYAESMREKIRAMQSFEATPKS